MGLRVHALGVGLGLLVLGCGFGAAPGPGPTVWVASEYPGATPGEVEQGVLLPLESAVMGLSGVEAVRSTGVGGRGTLFVSFESGSEPFSAMERVVGALSDASSMLPEDAERPVVSLVSTRDPLVLMVPEELAEQARESLLRTPGVLGVDVRGVTSTRTLVEIDGQRLAARGISLGEVLASGAGLSDGGPLIRTAAPEEVGDWLVRPGIRLADIAMIRVSNAGGSVRWTGDSFALLQVGLRDASATAVMAGLPDYGFVQLDPARSVEITGPVGPDLKAAVGRLVRALPEPPVVELGEEEARIWALAELDREAIQALPLPGVRLHWPTGHPAEVVLVGPVDARLSDAQLGAIGQTLLASETVADVRVGEWGASHLDVRVDAARAARRGISASEVTTAARMVEGVEVGSVTFRWSGGLEAAVVSGASGLVPLMEVARLEVVRPELPVERLDGRRVDVLRLELTQAGARAGLEALELPSGWTAIQR